MWYRKQLKRFRQTASDSAFAAAEAIMTTDRYPKLRSKTLSNGVRVVGVAKGAGMIEPNMATMLGYIMTDATIEKSKLQTMLSAACNRSFNSISIDGDESTSDTVVAIASGLKPLLRKTNSKLLYLKCARDSLPT